MTNSSRTPPTALIVDVLIVGAGPVGLYGAYYAGFRGLSVAVIDSLPEVGGQVSALYPEKHIYDVAGLPGVRAQALIDNLVQQAAEFAPAYLLEEQALTMVRAGDRVVVRTDLERTVRARAVIITGGIGTFSPRPLAGGSDYLGRGLCYFVPQLDVMRGLDVVVVGGGDSAVDWALALEGVARAVTLVHRRREFRAHPHSVARLRSSSVRLVLDANVSTLCGDERVESVLITLRNCSERIELTAQAVVAALGFVADLGPLASWGLEIHGRQIAVDRSMGTSVPGVYAAGDIAAYPGKVKLISVGFGEVATAVNNAAALLQPETGLEPGHSSDQVRGSALLSV
jgi:ferredoxin/flavodoxin---NADP+ reductase